MLWNFGDKCNKQPKVPYIPGVLHNSPKFFNNVFLFVGLTTLRTILNFDWFVESPNLLTTNCNQQKGWYCVSSLGLYVYEFNGHCPILLDPWLNNKKFTKIKLIPVLLTTRANKIGLNLIFFFNIRGKLSVSIILFSY